MVVLGGGIAGVTASYLLAQEGADVVLVEAGRIGGGTTGHTTAKVSSLHGMAYARLRSRFGADGAAHYGAANEEALGWITATAEAEGIECDLRERSAYTYTLQERRVDELEREAEAAAAAGVPASLVHETPLPFPVAAAVRAERQAEFHPVAWLAGLASAAERLGARIHEGTRATGVDEGRPCVVQTDHGDLQADRVIVATHYPFLDRGLFFARLAAQRSYALAMRIAGAAPDGMFLSADSPTRSLRAHPAPDGGETLIVGGEGHHVGRVAATEARYETLETWAREHFDVLDIGHRWSAQDPAPADGVPYVGGLRPFGDRVLVATGFNKWGMTNGTAAARMLADRIAGRPNPHASLFDSNRVDPRAAGPTLVKENASVALHFVGDRLARAGDPQDLALGEGAIVKLDGRRTAAYRDEAGVLHALSPTCTHLGCELRFNDAERSWDCPCHGSRFDAEDGRVLEGPAVAGLERRGVPSACFQGSEAG